jgi:hypothetical protein
MLMIVEVSEDKKNIWLSCLFSGFGIAFLTVLFVISGVRFILFFLESLQLQREVVVIYSSIFYAIIFFIARAGVRVKSHWQHTPSYEEYPEKEMEKLSKKKSLFSRIRNIMWISLGIYSILWVTPALSIYWGSPIYPNRVIGLCSFLFALTASAIYLIVKAKFYSLLSDRLIFFAGAFSGTLIPIFFLYLLF